MGKTETSRQWLHSCPGKNFQVGERVFHPDRPDLEMRVLSAPSWHNIACGWVDESGAQMSGLFYNSQLVRLTHAALRFNSSLEERVPGFGSVSFN